MESDAGRFPSGDLRVSDAERDRALSELGEAYQSGRITADEFDQRSTQALSARTGKELAAPLADLPPGQGPAGAVPSGTAIPHRAGGYLVSRLTIGVSLTAICFGGVAITNALRLGVNNGSSVLAPTMVALLCVVSIIVLRACARRR